MTGTTTTTTTTVSFSHVHLYVDHLEDLCFYKKLEYELNELSKKSECLDHETNESSSSSFLERKRQLWMSLTTRGDETAIETTAIPTTEFESKERDVVRQLLVGVGFRITAARYPGLTAETTTNTRTVLVTSRDPNGIQVIVTAAIDPTTPPNKTTPTTPIGVDPFHHFDAARVKTFYNAHNQRQGIAVLAFLVDNINQIRQRYESLHPKLVSHYQEYTETKQVYRNKAVINGGSGDGGCGIVKVLEVFAYYQEHDVDHSDNNDKREADLGTILRFLELPAAAAADNCVDNQCLLPGLVPQAATFEKDSMAAYSDHWVSNVISRTEFLSVLNDTVDFCPKVDFNAGVVAAGEAQIESTVTGNHSMLSTGDPSVALRDQSQVYLPINNALSEVGHVHLFLKEIGQGVQHVASRVQDLATFVQRVNDQRLVTGEGFSFLKIPRSYYGVLTLQELTDALADKECAQQVWNLLELNRLLSHDGAVDSALSKKDLDTLLSNNLPEPALASYQTNKHQVLRVILHSRFKNLYSLLRDHISEEKYLRIVRNQILVDIQGEDLLYQIFTCKILHRETRDEAPFFEFIERVCSECRDESGCPQKIRPGCGGFGIRNFLTLFLSIEVSKAMQEVAKARVSGDVAKQEYEQTCVDYFTAQLNESSPILTEISDAMTDEGHIQQQIAGTNDPKELKLLEGKRLEAEERKRAGNAKLMEVSAKYSDMMKSLRKKSAITSG